MQLAGPLGGAPGVDLVDEDPPQGRVAAPHYAQTQTARLPLQLHLRRFLLLLLLLFSLLRGFLIGLLLGG